jgi:hypothetical protein
MTPTLPNLNATIKLHQSDIPIRPISNWKNAPAYELMEHLTQTLHNYPHLPYTYNLSNSIHLITDPETVEINKDKRVCSFEIENKYTNIPKIDTANIIISILKINSGNNKNIQNEVLHILKLDGLAMGAPILAVLAESYIKDMEH